jgi:hypothetical protein
LEIVHVVTGDADVAVAAAAGGVAEHAVQIQRRCKAAIDAAVGGRRHLLHVGIAQYEPEIISAGGAFGRGIGIGELPAPVEIAAGELAAEMGHLDDRIVGGLGQRGGEIFRGAAGKS